MYVCLRMTCIYTCACMYFLQGISVCTCTCMFVCDTMKRQGRVYFCGIATHMYIVLCTFSHQGVWLLNVDNNYMYTVGFIDHRRPGCGLYWQ